MLTNETMTVEAECLRGKYRALRNLQAMKNLLDFKKWYGILLK